MALTEAEKEFIGERVGIATGAIGSGIWGAGVAQANGVSLPGWFKFGQGAIIITTTGAAPGGYAELYAVNDNNSRLKNVA